MLPQGNPGQSSTDPALASTLSNPYGQSYQYSSHYARAYIQPTAGTSMPMTTPDGYTLSSTYAPASPVQSQQPCLVGAFGHRGMRGSQSSRASGRGAFLSQRSQPQAHWYEPGNHRCTREQCTFTGSKKSVEIHMMDRHLIFPLGWDKRRRKDDWDADPSLKNGKPILIQGTSAILDTPEAINAWIAERKKRWPTASRVEEKVRKLQDAIARGEIAASKPNLRGKKRPRTDGGGMHGREQSGGRGRGRGTACGSRQAQLTTAHPLPKKPVALIAEKLESFDERSGSGSDMDPEKDAISSKPPPGATDVVMENVSRDSGKQSTVTELDTAEQNEKGQAREAQKPQKIQPVFRKPVRQPRTPPRNPFANHPSLLRNLLFPEIRMTVSNLSQAVHFLVENDLLENVELNPGEADNNKPVEVIGETR